MLKSPYFYNGLYKKYISIFGTLFNDIHLERENSAGVKIDDIIVPLEYGPKDKMLARLNADPSIDKTAAIVLPRMSFDMTSMYYDGDRVLNPVGKIFHKDSTDSNKFKVEYNSVAYNMSFSLYVYVKNEEDGTKIVEQILPYFKPDFNVDAVLIPELCITQSIPITLNNVLRTDSYEGDFRTRRAIIWQLDFTVKASFYGPVLQKPIIKFVKSEFDTGDIPTERLIVQPGLTANGQPTTSANNSVPVNTIFIDDNWGLVEIVEDL